MGSYLTVCFFLCHLVYGAQTYVNEDLSSDRLVQVLSQNPEVVLFAHGGKVYLEPARIIPSEQGMLLLKNDLSTIILPEVCSDAHGCFIWCPTECLLALDFGNCWNCSFKFFSGKFSICPQCQVPN